MKKYLLILIIGVVVFAAFPVLAAGKIPKSKTVYLSPENPSDAWGKITYNVSGSTFDFSFTGKAPIINDYYALIIGEDLINHPETAVMIAYPRSDGVTGEISINDSIELNRDLKKVKVWLVVGGDLNVLPHYDGYTEWLYWRPQYYLFGANLINYNDTDIP